MRRRRRRERPQRTRPTFDERRERDQLVREPELRVLAGAAAEVLAVLPHLHVPVHTHLHIAARGASSRDTDAREIVPRRAQEVGERLPLSTEGGGEASGGVAEEGEASSAGTSSRTRCRARWRRTRCHVFERGLLVVDIGVVIVASQMGAGAEFGGYHSGLRGPWWSGNRRSRSPKTGRCNI
jgi:hypothetical protein